MDTESFHPKYHYVFLRVEKALRLDQTFWGWPLLIICINLVLGVSLGAIQLTPDQIAQLQPTGNFALSVFLFGGSADGARFALNVVGGASVSIVTLTFSLTVLSIQMAAFNYTPRILDEFLRDYRTKISLGVYLGTFVYCFVVGWQIQSGSPNNNRVPIVAINFLIVQVIVVLSTFVHFIQYFVNEMRLESVLKRAAIGAIRAADSLEILHNDYNTNDDQLSDSDDETQLDNQEASQNHNVEVDENDSAKSQKDESSEQQRDETGEDQSDETGEEQSDKADQKTLFSGLKIFSKLPGGDETAAQMSRFSKRDRDRESNSPRSKDSFNEPNFDMDFADPDPLPPVQPRAYRILANKSGYVTSWTLHRIKRAVQQAGIVMRYRVIVGEFVTEGTQMAWAWPRDGDFSAMRERIEGAVEGESLHFSLRQRKRKSANRDSVTIELFPGSASPETSKCGVGDFKGCGITRNSSKQHALSSSKRAEQQEKNGNKVDLHHYFFSLANHGLCIGKTRSSDNDVTLGIRQLTDIALRALSPGVNDPQTAVQVLDYLSIVFARLARAKLPDVIVKDNETDEVLLAAPGRDFDFLLSTCMNPIRNYGKGDINVVRRAMYMLADIGSICVRMRQFSRVRTVLRQLKHWRDVVQNELPNDSMDYKLLSTVYESAIDEMEFAQYPRVSRGRQQSEEKERVDDGSGEKEE